MSFAYVSQTLGTWNPSIAARQYWDIARSQSDSYVIGY
jgi:hypothetical protein